MMTIVFVNTIRTFVAVTRTELMVLVFGILLLLLLCLFLVESLVTFPKRPRHEGPNDPDPAEQQDWVDQIQHKAGMFLGVVLGELDPQLYQGNRWHGANDGI